MITETDATTPKRITEGSAQQEAFWSELKHGSGNVVLEARAGTGKSSSCREAMFRLLDDSPDLIIHYSCLNKKIADEFREGCPPGAQVATTHSFGNRALRNAFNAQMVSDKSYKLLDTIEGGQQMARYRRKSVSDLVSLAKNTLSDDLGSLVDTYDINTYRARDEIIAAAEKVLERSKEAVNVYDFDDMLWLPAVHRLDFPESDFLFIDECQDLNPVQHALVPLMCPSGRVIAVGDPYQSIYAFRGADSESIPRLKAQLEARVLFLTVSWRCPSSHVEFARSIVPDFEAAPNAKAGTLVEGGMDMIDEAQPGEMVLCRSNAPLIAGCLRMVRARRKAVVRGRALGDQLIGIANKVGGQTVRDLAAGVRRWESKEVDRLGQKEGTEQAIEMVIDQAACLGVIIDTCGSPAEVPDVIKSLFDDKDEDGRVTFSTVHRAKGSEASRVTYLQVPYGEKRDKRRPPAQWEHDQRRNLRYVALTRSTDYLALVDARKDSGPRRYISRPTPPEPAPALVEEPAATVDGPTLSDLDKKRANYFHLRSVGLPA